VTVKSVAESLRSMAKDPRVDRFVQRARVEAAGMIEADAEFRALDRLPARLEGIASEIERLGATRGKKLLGGGAVDPEFAKLAAMVRALLPKETPP